ncbi:endonuclease/exonuclease/phosphatase family protein [Candidatus Kaiserbacteria bacterium]|nr:endonuclease/exonuclease/phosphatase family protein [Candidatus Kaiserbacteria bacterium]
MARISLVSLNIERKKNLERVIPFLRERKPDVVCLQEVCGSDISDLASAIGAHGSFYVPVTSQHELTGEINEHGICILSTFPMPKKEAKYYVGNASHLPVSDEKKPETYTSGQNRMVALANVETPDGTFRIGTTHFTWTPKGEANDLQRRDIKALLSILEAEKEFVLSGDFNAPRGGEIFSEIANRYKDNIPVEYKTSLDLVLHRAAKERLHEIENKMVDGLFTTPEYVASEVSLVSGVSDHQAVVADIRKA